MLMLLNVVRSERRAAKVMILPVGRCNWVGIGSQPFWCSSQQTVLFTDRKQEPVQRKDEEEIRDLLVRKL